MTTETTTQSNPLRHLLSQWMLADHNFRFNGAVIHRGYDSNQTDIEFHFSFVDHSHKIPASLILVSEPNGRMYDLSKYTLWTQQRQKSLRRYAPRIEELMKPIIDVSQYVWADEAEQFMQGSVYSREHYLNSSTLGQYLMRFSDHDTYLYQYVGFTLGEKLVVALRYKPVSAKPTRFRELTMTFSTLRNVSHYVMSTCHISTGHKEIDYEITEHAYTVGESFPKAYFVKSDLHNVLNIPVEVG